VISGFRSLGLEALIGIGGDGSMHLLQKGGYALSAVNTSSRHTIHAVLEAAATHKSDVPAI
jgi:fructose/tagatose bisphosphate aldolase